MRARKRRIAHAEGLSSSGIVCFVPRGSRHVETGLLLEGKPWLVLRRDDGGEWRLDGPARAYRLVGQRVRVDGVRDGFDLLAVAAIEPMSGRRSAPPTAMSRLKDLLTTFLVRD